MTLWQYDIQNVLKSFTDRVKNGAIYLCCYLSFDRSNFNVKNLSWVVLYTGISEILIIDVMIIMYQLIKYF